MFNVYALSTCFSVLIKVMCNLNHFRAPCLKTTDLVKSALQSKMTPLVYCHFSIIFQNSISSVPYPTILYQFSYWYYECPGMLLSFCCLETVILTSATWELWLKVAVCFQQIGSAQGNAIRLGTGSFIRFRAIWDTWMESEHGLRSLSQPCLKL